ncbi:hypothetical protein LC607_19905 [Nostoc sp. CHAB 5824]|nr:hypothetical protein [Nostoc sp. CHAB 5824]
MSHTWEANSTVWYYAKRQTSDYCLFDLRNPQAIALEHSKNKATIIMEE